MLPPNRFGYLFLHAIAFVELLVFSAPSIATPLPMPLAFMMADYSPILSPVNHSIFNDWYRREPDLMYPTTLQAKDVFSNTDPITSLNTANSYASDLKALARRSGSINGDDLAFQRDCVAALTGFNTNMDNFKTALVDASSASGTSDKGLANYDKTNDLETLLKQAVNLNKDVLKSTYEIVDNLPVIGPILGPPVYLIKCLLIDILNLVENSSDSVINKLQPLLESLLGKADCKRNVMLAGLCI